MAGAEDADLLIQALAAGAPVYCSEAVLCWRRASTESLRHRVDWTALRRYLLVKHRVFLEQWGGQPVRVGAEEEAAIWTRRRQAGLVRAEVGES